MPLSPSVSTSSIIACPAALVGLSISASAAASSSASIWPEPPTPISLNVAESPRSPCVSSATLRADVSGSRCFTKMLVTVRDASARVLPAFSARVSNTPSRPVSRLNERRNASASISSRSWRRRITRFSSTASDSIMYAAAAPTPALRMVRRSREVSGECE